MTSVVTSPAERNRAASGENLAVRHLTQRAERHIQGRQIDGKLAWLVESQTRPGLYYTVLRQCDGWQFDSCTCEDCAYRRRTCKHRRAVDYLSPAPTPAPAADSAAVTERMIANANAARKARGRTEWQEEV
jgi:hypothetical protein